MLKHFYITVSRIYSMIKNNTFLFTMLVIGITVCDIVFLYFWGNIVQANAIYTAPAFEVYGKGYADVKQISKEIKEAESLIFYSSIDKEAFINNDNKYYDIESYLSVNENNEIYIATSPEMSLILQNDTQLYTKNAVVVPDRIIGEKGKLPDLVINEVSYHVVGIAASRLFLVSMDTFFDNELPIVRVDIRLPAETTKEESAAFQQKLNSLFGDGFNIIDVSRSPDSSVSDILVSAIVVYMICLISLLYIITYIFEESAFELSVYELVGGTRRNLLLILCLDMLALLIISAIFAIVIHQMLYQAVFAKINVYEFVYTPEMYIYPMAMVISIMMILMIAFCRFRLKKYVVVNFRKYIK